VWDELGRYSCYAKVTPEVYTLGNTQKPDFGGSRRSIESAFKRAEIVNAQAGSRRGSVVAVSGGLFLAALGAGRAQTISPSRAFNAERLSALPRDECRRARLSEQHHTARRLRSPRRHDESYRVAPPVARAVLQQLADDGGRARVRRPQRRRLTALDSDNGALGSIVSTVTNGRNEMPAFGAVMSQDDLRDVAAYLPEDLVRD
jgi:hypothetical protein